MPGRVLISFFALAFGVSWGILALFIGFTAQAEALFGKMGYTNPLFIVAVYAPALAAVFLVWRHQGLAGLGLFCKRFVMWRMPWPWWLMLVLGIPAVFYSGAGFKGTLGDPLPFSPWTALLPALAAGLLIGPVEEIGWRGLALPLMQRQLAPFWAGLWLGAIWAVWHLPAFFLGGTPQSSWSFTGFFFGVVAMSVILTGMFNASRGSLLIPALFHFQANGPAWPDAQPWDSVVFVVLALLIVATQRERYFNRDAGVTDILASAVRARDLPEPRSANA
jgi:uncharacterized protein